MRTVKGPALLIAQLASDSPPFNTLSAIAKWAASLGYVGLQLLAQTLGSSISTAALRAKPMPTRLREFSKRTGCRSPNW